MDQFKRLFWAALGRKAHRDFDTELTAFLASPAASKLQELGLDLPYFDKAMGTAFVNALSGNYSSLGVLDLIVRKGEAEGVPVLVKFLEEKQEKRSIKFNVLAVEGDYSPSPTGKHLMTQFTAVGAQLVWEHCYDGKQPSLGVKGFAPCDHWGNNPVPPEFLEAVGQLPLVCGNLQSIQLQRDCDTRHAFNATPMFKNWLRLPGDNQLCHLELDVGFITEGSYTALNRFLRSPICQLKSLKVRHITDYDPMDEWLIDAVKNAGPSLKTLELDTPFLVLDMISEALGSPHLTGVRISSHASSYHDFQLEVEVDPVEMERWKVRIAAAMNDDHSLEWAKINGEQIIYPAPPDPFLHIMEPFFARNKARKILEKVNKTLSRAIIPDVLEAVGRSSTQEKAQALFNILNEGIHIDVGSKLEGYYFN